MAFENAKLGREENARYFWDKALSFGYQPDDSMAKRFRDAIKEKQAAMPKQGPPLRRPKSPNSGSTKATTDG
jgi:hypothetical protein